MRTGWSLVLGVAVALVATAAFAAPDFASMQVIPYAGDPLRATQARARVQAARSQRQGSPSLRPARKGGHAVLLGDLVTGLPEGVAFRQPDGQRAEGQGPGARHDRLPRESRVGAAHGQ